MIDRRLQFVRLHVGWMVLTVLVLVLLDSFSPILFYSMSLIGYFLVYEATATGSVRPPWRRRSVLVGGLLVVGFVAIAGYQVWRIVTST